MYVGARMFPRELRGYVIESMLDLLKWLLLQSLPTAARFEIVSQAIQNLTTMFEDNV